MKPLQTILAGAALALGTMAAAVAAAVALHPLDDIQQRAHAFLRAQAGGQAETPEVQVSPLDSRLRLARCEAPLEAFLPEGARALGNTSIGVRCPGPRPWTVYLGARVRVFGTVLVAGRFLPRGAILSAADVKPERRDLGTLPGGFETDPARLIGKRLQRSLQIEAAVSPQAVITPPAIRRGEQVTLLVRQGGMEVTSSGVALRDAALGERLQVRTASSERVIEGTVIAKHRVEVGL